MRRVPPITPNLITTIRLPLAPLAVAFLVTGTLWGSIAAAALSLVLEITDVADGYIARKYEVVSDFGKLYDPFADAFCRYTLFLGLSAVGVADLWMLLAIFYRDSAISFFRSVAAVRGQVLSARPSGKLKAIAQGVGTQVMFIAIAVGQAKPELTVTHDVAWWTMAVVTVITMASFVDYFVGNLSVLRDAWNDETNANADKH